MVTDGLDSGFHRSDDFLRVHQDWQFTNQDVIPFMPGSLTGYIVQTPLDYPGFLHELVAHFLPDNFIEKENCSPY